MDEDGDPGEDDGDFSPPRSLVMVCRVLVAGLLLHDEAHVLVGLRGALVVVQHLQSPFFLLKTTLGPD